MGIKKIIKQYLTNRRRKQLEERRQLRLLAGLRDDGMLERITQ